MTPIQKTLPLEARQEQVIPMTYEEYLADFDDATHAEWANGVAIVFMPPNIRRQRLFNFLFLLLGNYVAYLRLGELFAGPTAMRLAHSVREPDIFFVAQEHLDRVDAQQLHGPADLAIEIVSPESSARDRDEKFFEYQQAGILEYWLIDPRPGLERADFWVLDEQGKYRPVPLALDGVYRSTVLPGFWLDTNWLWLDVLPNPLWAFAQITGQDRALAPQSGPAA
ncbi:MAG TPA: Uma2 family endonuclease [Caldilineaceae bacterium]|nr:Uma2 family endonuclease [Caldilineaceae bacterium]